MRTSLLMMVGLALAGCAAGDSSLPDGVPVATRLTAGAALDVTHVNSAVMVSVQAGGGQTRGALGVRSGRVDLVLAGGELTVQELEVDLDDMAMAPGGLALRVRDAHLRLLGPAHGAASVSLAGERVSADLSAELVLEWTVDAGSAAAPHMSLRLPVPLHVEVTADDSDRLCAGLTLSTSGTFWSVPGTVEMADLMIGLRALE